MKNIKNYISADSCDSLATLFLLRVKQSPNNIAYRYCDKSTGTWHDLTWRAMAKNVFRLRSSMEREALQPGDRVALLLNNCPEWIAFEQAALSLGLIVVPLYANDRPENIAYILEHTESKLLLCPGITYWHSMSAVMNQLSGLQRIITVNPWQAENEDPRLTSLTDWLPAETETEIEYLPATHEIASIVYTSGTTGPPKGVMLSHKNILENAYAGLQCMDIFPSDSFLSFLPLSHMLERTAGYYLPMMAGATVAYARSIPELAEDLLNVQPTIMVAVPRIFERIYNGLMTKINAKPKLIGNLFHKAVEIGWQGFLHDQGRASWTAALLTRPLLDSLFGRKVRQKLGGQLRIIITGGAPLSADIARLFIGLKLPLYQGYGLTETSPIISVNRHDDNRPDGVGTPLPGTEVRIGEHDELLVRGSCVMQGYWKNEKATAETIDSNGWLYTGDRAVIEEGHIRITGRLKEILVLSNGEKVAPADLEMAIAMDPLFEHNLIIGEGKPYLTLLTVLNAGLWQEFAAELGISPEPESLALQQVQDAVLMKIEKLLAHFPGFVFVKHITLSLTPWTVEDGLLTPTLKLKRAAIGKHMKEEIEHMYTN